MWLRVRRVLVGRLESVDAWPSVEMQRRDLRARIELGERLRRDVLGGALDARDLALLGSDGAYGRASPGLALRLPLVLSFGYELGRTFYELHEGPGDGAEDAGTLGAIFNLGISLFDLLHDRYPELTAPLRDRFDEGALDRLSDSTPASHALAALALRVEEAELRILLSLIAVFYRRLGEAQGDRVARAEVHRLLRLAYRAELATAGVASSGTARDAGRAKSTLPFSVLAHASGLLAGRRSSDLFTIAEDIGTVFWLTDDLVDVPADVRDGAVNSLLPGLRCAETGASDPRAAQQALADLLESDRIEAAVDDLTAALLRARQSLRSGAFPSEPSRVLCGALGFYIRSWLE